MQCPRCSNCVNATKTYSKMYHSYVVGCGSKKCIYIPREDRDDMLVKATEEQCQKCKYWYSYTGGCHYIVDEGHSRLRNDRGETVITDRSYCDKFVEAGVRDKSQMWKEGFYDSKKYGQPLISDLVFDESEMLQDEPQELQVLRRQRDQGMR